MNEHLKQILQYFRNLTLNSLGVNRSLYELLNAHDVSKALDLLQNNDVEVDEAIKEYNPQTHDIMKRPNKNRDSAEPYQTCKLPRTRQRYINDVELFFLLGKPIVWHKDDGDDEAFTLFTDFLKDQYFNSRIREAKRLAGAETESALLFHIYRDESKNEAKVKSLVLARSTGYRLRPLIDQYGNMTAFAYGYILKEGGRNVQHWDFQTADALFFCKKGTLGWDVEVYPNPTGKINVIYFKQPKAWDGAECRIAREEMIDSITGDINNYFGDPIAAATADVIDNLADPDTPGKLIQLGGDKSRFEYINPPQASQTRDAEKNDLQASILFDTYTPDFDIEKMKGFGTLSGAAIRNAMILGYIKRDNRREIYEELIDRLRNVVLRIVKYFHPEKAAAIDALKVSFEFSEPFSDEKQSQWGSIAQLFGAGLVSLETAVGMLSLTDAPESEVQKLRDAAAQAAAQKEAVPADKPKPDELAA